MRIFWQISWLTSSLHPYILQAQICLNCMCRNCAKPRILMRFECNYIFKIHVQWVITRIRHDYKKLIQCLQVTVSWFSNLSRVMIFRIVFDIIFSWWHTEYPNIFTHCIPNTTHLQNSLNNSTVVLAHTRHSCVTQLHPIIHCILINLNTIQWSYVCISTQTVCIVPVIPYWDIKELVQK